MNHIIYRDQHITVFQSALFQTNSTVVVTQDVVLVIDPCWLPEEVNNIRQYVDSIRGKFPVFLIFTHSDFDHVIGYRAFQPEKIFVSEAFQKNPNRERVVEDMKQFDDDFYIRRSYPLEYPVGNYVVFRDGIQFRYGNTRLAFYLAPGHTADSMIIVVWQMGILIAGDYLSDIEFPFIRHSSLDYEETLHKLPRIHDRNWFTKMIPGHGSPALTINDWLDRRTESLEYIYALRESIATGLPFDEAPLWKRYGFQRSQRKEHQKNLELLTKEFENGLWSWDESMHQKKVQAHRLSQTEDEGHDEL